MSRSAEMSIVDLPRTPHGHPAQFLGVEYLTLTAESREQHCRCEAWNRTRGERQS